MTVRFIEHNINDYRAHIQEQMVVNDNLYEEIMERVDYNTHQTNKAVDIYCYSMMTTPVMKSATWFDEKTTCVDSEKTCYCLEKICS